jgi:prepilin-type N-terminal cleavage/methylation domain-containing protein
MIISKRNAFTLIELLVVISIIAILAGIALPVFGEVQVRGAQTKALSNAKQVGLACKLFAQDYNGNFPLYTNLETKAEGGNDSNSILQTLIPDYIPEKSVFAIPKSAYCKGVGKSSGTPDKLNRGENEWAYVKGLSDTSNARFPLLADGFAPNTTYYIADDSLPGGVWKAKKAVVVRVDISGTVETLYKKGTGAQMKGTVKRSEDEPTKNAFETDPGSGSTQPWLTGTGVKVLTPLAP